MDYNLNSRNHNVVHTARWACREVKSYRLLLQIGKVIKLNHRNGSWQALTAGESINQVNADDVT